MYRLRVDAVIFEGQSNAYLLGTDGPGPTSLIDTGIATPEAESQLRDGLATHEISFEDIDQILLTHFHYDHAGLVGTIQRESDAVVYCHPDDAPFIERSSTDLHDQFSQQDRQLTEWGVPSRQREVLRDFLDASISLAGEPAAVTPVNDGDTIVAGERTATVCHVPGHTLGHVAYDFDGDVVAGDTMLPTYTANVGGSDPRVEQPLATYFSSLRRLLAREPNMIYPGHRDAIQDPLARANEIIQHHRHRAQRIVHVLGQHGASTPWDVARELFGELDTIHILNGTGEAAAHLAYLRAHGHVERSDGTYEVLDEVVEGTFPQFT